MTSSCIGLRPRKGNGGRRHSREWEAWETVVDQARHSGLSLSSCLSSSSCISRPTAGSSPSFHTGVFSSGFQYHSQMCPSPGTHQNCRQKAVRVSALAGLCIQDPDRTTQLQIKSALVWRSHRIPATAGWAAGGVTFRNLKDGPSVGVRICGTGDSGTEKKCDSFMQGLRVERTEAERAQKRTHRRWDSGEHQRALGGSVTSAC